MYFPKWLWKQLAMSGCHCLVSPKFYFLHIFFWLLQRLFICLVAGMAHKIWPTSGHTVWRRTSGRVSPGTLRKRQVLGHFSLLLHQGHGCALLFLWLYSCLMSVSSGINTTCGQQVSCKYSWISASVPDIFLTTRIQANLMEISRNGYFYII